MILPQLEQKILGFVKQNPSRNSIGVIGHYKDEWEFVTDIVTELDAERRLNLDIVSRRDYEYLKEHDKPAEEYVLLTGVDFSSESWMNYFRGLLGYDEALSLFIDEYAKKRKEAQKEVARRREAWDLNPQKDIYEELGKVPDFRVISGVALLHSVKDGFSVIVEYPKPAA